MVRELPSVVPGLLPAYTLLLTLGLLGFYPWHEASLCWALWWGVWCGADGVVWCGVVCSIAWRKEYINNMKEYINII